MTRKPIPTRTEIAIDILWITTRGLLGSIIYIALTPYFVLMLIATIMEFIVNKLDFISEYSGYLYPLSDSPIGYFSRAIKSTKVLFRYKYWVKQLEQNK